MTFSDHKRIAFNVKAVKDKTFKKPVGWQYATTNWPSFQLLVEKYLKDFVPPSIWDNNLIESKFNQIYKAINKALNLKSNPVRAYVAK